MAQDISLIPNGNGPGAKRSGLAMVREALRTYRSLTILAVVLAVLAGVYFALAWWRDWALQEAARVQNEKSALVTDLEGKDFEGARVFADQVRGVQRVLAAHPMPSHFFEAFDESVHPQVRIDDFDLDVKKRELRVVGLAPSLEVLGEQFVIWRDQSTFAEEVALEQFVNTSEGGVQFSFTMKIKPGLLE